MAPNMMKLLWSVANASKGRTPVLPQQAAHRGAVTLPTGAFKEEPQRNRLGLLGVIATVIPGLLIGASISKNFASFLEENDLFVPADDDDDM